MNASVSIQSLVLDSHHFKKCPLDETLRDVEKVKVWRGLHKILSDAESIAFILGRLPESRMAEIKDQLYEEVPLHLEKTRYIPFGCHFEIAWPDGRTAMGDGSPSIVGNRYATPGNPAMFAGTPAEAYTHQGMLYAVFYPAGITVLYHTGTSINEGLKITEKPVWLLASKDTVGNDTIVRNPTRFIHI